MIERSPDYYLREPSRGLAWNELEVMVRPADGGWWEYSVGYQLPTVGYGSPYSGRAPNRETAGRIGLIQLRNALNRLARDEELEEERSADQRIAAAREERIQEMLSPRQGELFAGGF
jgi:hypothetical protein